MFILLMNVDKKSLKGLNWNFVGGICAEWWFRFKFAKIIIHSDIEDIEAAVV